MKNIDNDRFGSTLDDLLESEGELTQITALAHKHVLAWKIAEAMKKKHINKVEMAKRMHTSRSAVDRLLNAQNPSVTLDTMDRAAAALGMTLFISLEEKSRFV
jgi:antitoxin HicB